MGPPGTKNLPEILPYLSPTVSLCLRPRVYPLHKFGHYNSYIVAWK